MGEITPRRSLARLLLGLFMMCVGSFVAWKSHQTFPGIFGKRLLPAVGGIVAMYGFMSLLGSGALAILMVLGGAGFFLWSLWTVSSGGGNMDAARFGLWFGPLCGAIALLFVRPFWRSEASKKSK